MPDTSASANLKTRVGAPLGVSALMARAGSPLGPRVILRRRRAGVKGEDAGREERRRAREGAGEASGTVSTGGAGDQRLAIGLSGSPYYWASAYVGERNLVWLKVKKPDYRVAARGFRSR